MFNIGDRVRVRSWNDLKAEYGTERGGTILKTPYKIDLFHKNVCGSEATVVRATPSITKGGIIRYELGDWDSGGKWLGFRDTGICQVNFCEEMLEPASGVVKLRFDEEEFFKMLSI